MEKDRWIDRWYLSASNCHLPLFYQLQMFTEFPHWNKSRRKREELQQVRMKFQGYKMVDKTKKNCQGKKKAESWDAIWETIVNPEYTHITVANISIVQR